MNEVASTIEKGLTKALDNYSDFAFKAGEDEVRLPLSLSLNNGLTIKFDLESISDGMLKGFDESGNTVGVPTANVTYYTIRFE